LQNSGIDQVEFALPVIAISQSLLLQTFVDRTRFQGTAYRAANRICLGLTQGFCGTREGYNVRDESPKRIFAGAATSRH
jgi:hypothetical protein